MSQFLLENAQGPGPIYAVLVSETLGGRYQAASMNGLTKRDTRTTLERLSAMKRLYLKMAQVYPHGRIELVAVIPIDAGSVDGEIKPEDMCRKDLVAEVRRLRALRGKETL